MCPHEASEIGYDLLNTFSPDKGLETAKCLQIEAVGDRIEFRLAVESRIKWKNILRQLAVTG